MASIQQSVNSLFSSALAASVTGSHAFRQSALGQRWTAARKQKAELANINKTLAAYAPGGEINPGAHEGELKAIEGLGEKGREGVLNLAALTGDVERARAGLQRTDEINRQVDKVRAQQRGKAAEAAEKEYEDEQREKAAKEFKNLPKSEQAAGLAAGAAAEETIAILARKFGGK